MSLISSDNNIEFYANKYAEFGVDSEWKFLELNPSRYIISDGGKIVSFPWTESYLRSGKTIIRHHPDRLVEGKLDREGYCLVTITSITGVINAYRLHRLVAQTFLPNPENKRTVNHINGIKSDNRLINLEWATDYEQQVHAIQTGLKDIGVHLKCLDTGKKYKSLKEAGDDLESILLP